MTAGTHTVQADERNQRISININGELYPRDKAVVSVFDSGFILGDGIWEGLRLHRGVIPFLDRHLARLWEGAKALDLDPGLSRAGLKRRLYDTVDANGMESDVHIRLMVSRGIKSTPYQDPAMTVGGPTIVIIPEYKMPDPGMYDRGVRLYTVYVRRGYADVQDPRINSHSKLNCIFGCIQAGKAGYDEALMLDPHGHVATCNSTHFFIVRDGEVWTSSGDYCLDGITRRNVIDLCKADDIPVYERNFSVMQAYGAGEAFVTGTFAGLTPVSEIDGRIIGDGRRADGSTGDGSTGDGEAGDGRAADGSTDAGEVGDGRAGDGRAGAGEAGDGRAGDGRAGPITRRLQALYRQLIDSECGLGRQ